VDSGAACCDGLAALPSSNEAADAVEALKRFSIIRDIKHLL